MEPLASGAVLVVVDVTDVRLPRFEPLLESRLAVDIDADLAIDSWNKFQLLKQFDFSMRRHFLRLDFIFAVEYWTPVVNVVKHF